MQRVSTNHSTIYVSNTALEAVLRDIRGGESSPDFFDGRYEDEGEPDTQAEQEQEVEA